jgi:DNA-binding GntR family transcriptional regulator
MLKASASKPVLLEIGSRRPVSDLEYVYEELKQSCMIGEFEPGQKLTLPVLAEAFGTSQMPIREATNRLIAARAMEAPPRKSLCMPEATVERLESLLPLRLLLEGEATFRAAEFAGESLGDELQKINDDLDVLAEKDDIKAHLRQNQLFHFTVYRACGNDDFIDLIELLWMRYGPLMSIVRSGALSATGHLNHASVVKAIRRRDREAAAAAIRADLSDAAKSIRDAITSNIRNQEATARPRNGRKKPGRR